MGEWIVKDGLWGFGSAQRKVDELNRQEEARRDEEFAERQRTEELIIEHTEKATGTKAITVDGELKYIPIKEAKKLGLV